jgi:hypothetical protein
MEILTPDLRRPRRTEHRAALYCILWMKAYAIIGVSQWSQD